MATAIVAPSESATFEDQISKVKNEIETRFSELIDCLRKRKRELLNELEEILNSYKSERDKHKQSIAELERTLKLSQENMKSDSLKEFCDSILKQITEKRKEFESQLIPKRISLHFDKSVFDLAVTVGQLTVTNATTVTSRLPVVDYKGKLTPVLSIGGTRGSNAGKFSYPFGVTVDYQTGNIFVGDKSNNRVQVFDNNGKYLYKFGDVSGAGKMSNPLSIALYQNKVFVSQHMSGCLLVYDLNGTFIKQIGSKGSGEGQLNSPHGLSINETNGDIYVCDNGNKRVQLFSKDFLFKSQFGQGILTSPSDIKLTNEYIYVLSYSNPFLYSFNYNLSQAQNTLLNSISKHLSSPWSFCIDGSGKFFISDYTQNAILIFDDQGDLVHKITDSVQNPLGITLDWNGRIIPVGHNDHLLIF